jgi:hypothetical protein
MMMLLLLLMMMMVMIMLGDMYILSLFRLIVQVLSMGYLPTGIMLIMREIKHQIHLLYLSIYTTLLYPAELNYLHNNRM